MQSPSHGLDSSVISSIPQFVFSAKEQGGKGLVCVICLSLFGDEEIGRKLASCNHCFHVECIDMWLHSHTTCPICRAPAVQALDHFNNEIVGELLDTNSNDLGESGAVSIEESRLEIIVEVPNAGNENEINDTFQRKLHTSSNINWMLLDSCEFRSVAWFGVT
ncbi:hypothetical protein ACJIZ3_012470 [Penstemon smallii]|uniref:RING-type E3 ubiquitin transferase n=1 Tax=Penstemon smallii TaxID=265156 RepID=A0ABD3UQE2_9LAMI